LLHLVDRVSAVCNWAASCALHAAGSLFDSGQLRNCVKHADSWPSQPQITWALCL